LLVTESEIKSGPAAGKTGQNQLSDYQEVDGLYFPFSMTQGIKDGNKATMMIKNIELNPSIDDAEFAMPVEAPAPEEAAAEETAPEKDSPEKSQ